MHTTPFYSIIDDVSQKELSSLRLPNVSVMNKFIVMQYDLLVNTCTFKRNLFVLQRQVCKK